MGSKAEGKNNSSYIDQAISMFPKKQLNVRGEHSYPNFAVFVLVGIRPNENLITSSVWKKAKSI